MKTPVNQQLQQHSYVAPKNITPKAMPKTLKVTLLKNYKPLGEHTFVSGPEPTAGKLWADTMVELPYDEVTAAIANGVAEEVK